MYDSRFSFIKKQFKVLILDKTRAFKPSTVSSVFLKESESLLVNLNHICKVILRKYSQVFEDCRDL